MLFPSSPSPPIHQFALHLTINPSQPLTEELWEQGFIGRIKEKKREEGKKEKEKKGSYKDTTLDDEVRISGGQVSNKGEIN